MQINTTVIRSGFDGKKCFVHARFCETPSYLIATAQYLTDITACDLFDGIYSSKSYDGGKTWTEFVPEAGLAAIDELAEERLPYKLCGFGGYRRATE